MVKIYWDSSCFICFLNKSETSRRETCEDVLFHAERGHVELWTSVLTIAEVIRPKAPFQPEPLPEWTKPIRAKVPDAIEHIERLWLYHCKGNRPSRSLTEKELQSIGDMFEWPFLRKVLLDESIARKAVSLSRQYKLRPVDAIHAASALAAACPVLQHWDKDYDRAKSVIHSENPARISTPSLFDSRELGGEPDAG